MQPIKPTSVLAVLAACGLLLASARAEEAVKPPIAAELDGLSEAFDAVMRDAQAFAAAAGRLQAKAATDPTLTKAVQARLRDMMERSDGLSPEIQAFLAPLLLFLAVPHDGAGRPAAPLDLGFVAADDRRGVEAAFIVGPGHQSPPQRYRLAWQNMPAGSPTTLGITLSQGVNFHIVGNDCPERPTGSGSCEVTVAFDIAGNAIRTDTIVASYGLLKRMAGVSGQGAGFPPADPRIVAPVEATVRLDPDHPDGDNRVTFTVVNAGPGALPPFSPRIGSREEGFSHFWQVDPSSTCATATTAAGGSCTLVLAFNPTHNGQESVIFALPDPAGEADPRKRGEAFGYARGFAETLPPGLLANGDPCPAPGAAAEVVLGRSMGRLGVSDGATRLDTLSCGAWQRDGEGMRCADPGILEGGTRRFWTRADMGQPWRLSSVVAEVARVTCRDGRVDRVLHPRPRSDDSVLHR
ncbi:MAG: hypothetical protein U1E40_10495 [Amaricoccus sp.]